MRAAESDRVAPELLAPAGDWECLRAAVASGADAVYFGLPRFNARMRADNFSDADLPEVMQYLHRHGVAGYVALNVLIFPDEIADAIACLEFLESCGVDAVIVQDVGLAGIARQVAPGLRVHASTQMTVTSPEGAAFAAELGVRRAVLARELSLREIARFRSGGLPVEVFVHGALCVAYSGQCLTSEALGRRSANRGECAQACRMPYEMVVDGKTVDLGDQHYLLSPQDLAAVREIPDLIRAGVESFKIEGRLKSAEYVAAVTAVYRRAIDDAMAGVECPVSKDDWYRLEMTFSRGLYPGWLHGVNHQELVGARYGKKRGHFLGVVTSVEASAIRIEPAAGSQPAKLGDGVVIENPADTGSEAGGRVFAVDGSRIVFGRGRIDLRAVSPGAGVWKTDDPALNREIAAGFRKDAGTREARAVPLDVEVTGRVGECLRATFSADGRSVRVESERPLVAAKTRPLTTESLRRQFGKLGGTAFALRDLSVDLEGAVLLPASALNAMRRAAISELENRPIVARQQRFVLADKLDEIRNRPSVPPPAPVLTVLARTWEQAQIAAECGVHAIYLDFEDIRRYADAVLRLREIPGCPPILLATPRIQKAGEEGFFKRIERAHPDGVLLRNPGSLAVFKKAPLMRVGDFSLNVANPLAAAVFIPDFVERVTASYDLNANQLLALARDLPPGWLEVTIHQHMPMFHMEHCVFAAFLSEGTDDTNCGRPCESHRVHLRDRVGIEHPLRADVGCRNTLFNATAQTGAKYFQAFANAGVRVFRVELFDERGAEARESIGIYLDLLAGRRDGDSLWRELKAIPKLGVTEGTLAE